MTTSFRIRFVLGFCVLGVTACAGPSRSSIESGQARLLTETISVQILTIKGILDNKGLRFSAQTSISDCKSGSGSVQLETGSYIEYLSNVVASQASPSDKLFKQLCEFGMPIYRQQEADWNRRFAEMTPEQREAQRKLLLQLYLAQQAQQAESNRNASQERAAKSLADAIRDSQKTTTICTASTPWYVKCETK